MFAKRYYKSFQELRGFTSIDISSKTIEEIKDTLDNYKDNKDEYLDNVGIPIREGIIISRGLGLEGIPDILKDDIENTKIVYYFKINEKDDKNLSLYWEEYMFNPKDKSSIGLSAYEVLIGDKIGDIKRVDCIDKYNPPTFNIVRNKMSSSNAKNSLAYLIHSLLYISVVQSNRKVVYKQSKGVKFVSKTTNNSNKTTDTIKVEVLNNDKVMYIMNGNEGIIKGFRNYVRKAESWLVSGHWRKYSNGTMKWIESYVKGKGKLNPKHYKVK